MASTTFFLQGDPAAAHAVVDRIVAERGYTGVVEPSGLIRISRGSLPLTLVVGALAGQRFHLSFTLAYGADQQGRQIVRLDRDGATSAIKGGAIGFAKTENVFRALVDAVGGALSSAGLFLAVEHA